MCGSVKILQIGGGDLFVCPGGSLFFFFLVFLIFNTDLISLDFPGGGGVVPESLPTLDPRNG